MENTFAWVLAFACVSAQANQFECERAQRNLATAGSSVTASKAAIERSVAAAQREVDIKCFGPDRASQIEKARAGAPKITIQADPPSITHCDRAYCYTDRGDAILRPHR